MTQKSLPILIEVLMSEEISKINGSKDGELTTKSLSSDIKLQLNTMYGTKFNDLSGQYEQITDGKKI